MNDKEWRKRLGEEVYKRTLALQDSLRKQKALNEMRTQFVAIMSHELRTPVTALTGYADTLRHKWKTLPDSKIQKYLDTISEESNRMVTLMQEIFEISSILEGTLDLSPEKVNLTPLVASVIREFRARHPRCSFGFKENSEALESKVDPSYFKNALGHILFNAVKYTPAEGHVLVFADRNGNEAVIRIEDEGPGVPPEYREKIFEPFFRSMDDVNRKTPGAGLGLSIARGIIQAFRGQVAIVDKLTGKTGCAMAVRLPLIRGR